MEVNNHMKKIFSYIMILIFIFSLLSAGCIDSKNVQDKNNSTSENISLVNESQKEGITVFIQPGEYTLEELKDMSTYIVIGKVTEILPSRWSSIPTDLKNPTDNQVMFTDVNISIEEYLKNPLPQQNITVRTMGGETDDYVYEVDLSPKFQHGERVLLFLSHDTYPAYSNISPEHYIVTGYNQGKYTLNDNGTIKTSNDTLVKTDQLISSIQ